MAETQTYLTDFQKKALQDSRDDMARSIQFEYNALTPDKLNTFNSIGSKYPHLSKDLVMAMVRSGLNGDTPGLDKISTMDGIAQLKRDARNVSDIKSAVKQDKGILGTIQNAVANVTWDPLKGVTRVGFATLRSIYDYATVLTRDLTQGVPTSQLAKDMSQGIFGEATQLGQLARNWSSQGTGFFITPESKVGKEQAKAMAKYGKIYGDSFTIGRYAARGVGAGPNTTAYKIMSGLVDATLNIGLDPSTYLGAGAVTKVVGQGRQLAKAKGEIAGIIDANPLKEALTIAEEKAAKIEGIRTRNANKWNKAQAEYQQEQAHIVKSQSNFAKKMLAMSEKQYFLPGEDAIATKTLSEANVAEWVATHPKAASGELLDAVDNLSATDLNTGKAFQTHFILDELPQSGKVSVAVNQLDEFVITGAKDVKWKIMDLTDDFADASEKVIAAELKKRGELLARIETKASDFSNPPALRQAYDDIVKGVAEEGKSLEGFVLDGIMTGKMTTMSSLIAKAIATKNPDAAMALIDDISDIWKVDGFSNIRSLYGETGGFALGNIYKKAEARGAQIGNALAEIADPTNLGPNAAKLAASLEEPTARVAKMKEKLTKAQKLEAEHAQFTKDLGLFRQLVDSDPELLQKIVNDPNYEGLGKFLSLKTGKDKSIIEYLNEQVGITDTFAGEMGSNFGTALKYLLGRNFENIAKVVADETDAFKIRNYFGKKLDAEMVTALTAAKTADEVMAVFLRNLGAETADPKIFRSMALNAKALDLSASPLARLVEPINPAVVRTAETISRSYNRYFVRSKFYNLGDKTGLTDGVENWLSSTRLASVIGKGTQEAIIEDTVRKILLSESNQQRAAIVDNMTTQFGTAIAKRLDLSAEDADKLLKAMKVSGKERAEKMAYSVNQISEAVEPTMINAAGETIMLPGGGHEFQLLNDFVSLPDTVEIQKIVNKFELNSMRFGGKFRGTQAKIAAEELGDIWRSAQLVFRISYVLRNIAEMQMRQFLSGHASIFTHPIQFTAMVMADANGNAFQRKLAERWARYQYDLADNAFKNADAEGDLLEAVQGYQQVGHRTVSTSDYRKSSQSEIFKFYRVVGTDHKDYYKGLGFTLNRFASDKLDPKIAGLLLNNASQEDKMAFVNRLISEYDKPDNILREFVTGAFDKNPGIKQMFLKNPELEGSIDNLSPENIYIYMFDETQEHTLAAQIMTVAGTGPKKNNILELIAYGKTAVRGEDGVVKNINTPWITANKTVRELDASEKEFAKRLEAVFSKEDIANSRVLSERERVATLKEGGIFKRGADIFFDAAAREESKWNFGPEYMMSYWDHVGRYARVLSTEDLKYVKKKAYKNLRPIGKTVGNRFIPIGQKHPTLRVIDTELKKRLKNPEYGAGVDSSWQAVHKMAAREAASYTKNLFYDAANQRQWAQAWRLVFPFAQAQANTVSTWGRLIKNSKVPAYKFGRAYQAATKQGSNVIYDATGVTYDEDQGFIYKDKTTGEERFTMPIVGSVLGSMAGLGFGPGAPKAQISAPLQSLNLATGQANPMMFGVGPAMQLGYMFTRKNNSFGPAYDVFRDIVTPYGEPQSVQDIVFPSWIKKSFAYALGDQTSVNRGMKDWASYLASTGNYGDNPLADDSERTRLFEDARNLSQSMGLLTALFQSISPATPSAEVVAKIKSPENKQKFMTLTLLADAWNKISEAYPGEYGKAVVEFADQFGANNLMIAIGGTTQATRGTDDAWNFLNQNPEAAGKYARNPGDVVPYFFPGGNFSLKYYNWQKKTSARRPLTTNELEVEAEGLVYAMRKDQIEEEMIAGNQTVFWYNEQIAKLDEQFNGKPTDFVQTGTIEEKLGRIKDALADPAFKQSPVYNETAEFYVKFAEFRKELNRLKVANYAELGGKSWYATTARNELVALAETFMTNNPAFSRMYYGVFAGQLEG